MTLWVRPSLYVVAALYMRVTMRFSSETLCSERTLCVVDHSLGLHPRDFSRIVWPGSPDRPHVALSDACCRGPHRSGLVHSTTPSMRFGPPLATSPVKFGIPGFPCPGTFRPCVFSTLRRLTPSAGLPVLFHTGATYGVQRARTNSPGDAPPASACTPKSTVRPGCVQRHNPLTERETLLSTEVSSIELSLLARWSVP